MRDVFQIWKLRYCHIYDIGFFGMLKYVFCVKILSIWPKMIQWVSLRSMEYWSVYVFINRLVRKSWQDPCTRTRYIDNNFDMPRFPCDLVALCTLVIAIERTNSNENPKSSQRQITSSRVMSIAQKSSTVKGDAIS